MTVGSQVRTCLATIKSIENELSTLAIKTNEHETKQALNDATQLIHEIKSDLNQQMIHISNEEPQYK